MKNKIFKEINAKQAVLASEFASKIQKPLYVAVIGEGGAGKSTLINTLFGTNLPTNSVKDTTKLPEPVKQYSKDKKHCLIFIDMPGLGYEENQDLKNLEYYVEKGKLSDIIFWSINTENRNLVFIISTLRALLSKLQNDEEKIKFFNKIIFVVTKADLKKKGWSFRKLKNSSNSSSYINKDLKFIFNEQEMFIRSGLINKFKDLVSTTVFFKGNSKPELVNEKFFDVDGNKIVCNKFIDGATYENLLAKYPKNKNLINKIVLSQSPIVCSSKYKYNLLNLLQSVINKAGAGIFEIEFFIDLDRITQLTPLEIEDIKSENPTFR